MFIRGQEPGTGGGEIVDGDPLPPTDSTVETSTGGTARVPLGTGFGELTSGGLY
jgi:penicillin-binding protein 1A